MTMGMRRGPTPGGQAGPDSVHGHPPEAAAPPARNLELRQPGRLQPQVECTRVAGADAQIDPAGGQVVQRGGCTGGHHRMPRQRVRDPGAQRNVMGVLRNCGQRHPWLAEQRRRIPDADAVVAHGFGGRDLVANARRAPCGMLNPNRGISIANWARLIHVLRAHQFLVLKEGASPTAFQPSPPPSFQLPNIWLAEVFLQSCAPGDRLALILTHLLDVPNAHPTVQVGKRKVIGPGVRFRLERLHNVLGKHRLHGQIGQGCSLPHSAGPIEERSCAAPA